MTDAALCWPLKYCYFDSPMSYTVRAPRKGTARQRRRSVRRRIRIAVLVRRLGGEVTFAD